MRSVKKKWSSIPSGDRARRVVAALGRRVVSAAATFYVTAFSKFSRTAPLTDAGSPIVICMASYGRRLQSAKVAIASIARGSVKPGRLILVVDADDCLDNDFESLRARGLEIWRGDARLGPHNKWYPFAVAEPHFDGLLVTADDDVIYPRWWLALLAARGTSHQVTAYRAHPIRIDVNGIAPYNTWLDKPFAAGDHAFVTGVGGVMYPGKFVRDMVDDGELFLAQCPRADDVWINRTIIRHGWPVALVRERSQMFPLVWGSQTTSLAAKNVVDRANDQQIKATFGEVDVARLRASMVAQRPDRPCIKGWNG